ncbi:MAG: glycerophosphodiester phosphodiesterase [Verrucomicrobiaceae bacterium]|nr:glycerophosphodiester phosphodiesterase [Verrucomicrobiaceae bacterium]
MKQLGFYLFTFVTAAAQPVTIAHRGASGYVPEHTREAKVMAHAMGAEFIEQDVVLSQDDVPVVLHDIHLDTTSDVAKRFPDRKRADGRYYALDFTLAELRQLSMHERLDHKTGKQAYPKRFPATTGGFRILTLDEELELIAGLNQSTGRVAGIYPEIKQPAWHRKEGHDISPIVLRVLARHGYTTKEHACYLQCFEFEEVKRLRYELGWKGQLVFLAGSKIKIDLAELAKVVDGIGPSIGAIVSERQVTDLASQAHALGLEVHPYTLRIDDLPKGISTSEELMRLLFDEAKVDALFTDFPDATVNWLKKTKSR